MKTVSKGSRALVAFISLHLAAAQQAVVFAQAVQEAPVPANTNTTVTESANGTPVVNIATPNASGLSHNFFNSYDVGQRGLILNNSAENAVSLIGGGVVGNANLTNGSASLILNEVVSANAGSMLRGYQEILGPAAELVIANPWGITCDGCGFVNTPRVTLTTGRPTLSGGGLAGFTITGGQLAVTGAGLDASRQAAVDLLARRITIDGDVFVGGAEESLMGDLRVFGGAHEFDYANRSGSALAGEGAAPEFAIDSSALGGMYADRIQLLVTEQGAGVRAAGDLAAFSDDLTIAADGSIALRGAASAARDINVSGGNISFDQPGSDSFVYAGRDLTMSARGALSLATGSVGAERSVLFTGNSLTDSGSDADLRFSGDLGSLHASVASTLNLSGGFWVAPQLSFESSSAVAGPSSVLHGYGTSGNALQITTAGALSITGAELYSGADASLTAQRLEVDADGVIAASGTLSASVARGSTGGVDNAGVLQGAAIDIVASGAADGTTTSFANRATGVLFSDGALIVSEADRATGSGSQLVNEGVIASDAVVVDTGETNNTGVIQAESSLNLLSESLSNVGADAIISATGSAESTVHLAATTVTNSGTIWSDGDLSLNPTTLQQQREATAATNPLIGAGRDLDVAFTGIAELGPGDLYAGRNLSITGEGVRDSGATGASGGDADLRYAGGALDVTASAGHDIELGGGQWYAEGDLNLIGDNVLLGARRDGLGVLTTPGFQLLGARGGTGTTRLTARTGSISLFDDAGVFSGGDLLFEHNAPFVLSSPNVLQADGAIRVTGSGSFAVSGTIFGRSVELEMFGGPLDFHSSPTGLVYGEEIVRIGTPTQRANTIYVDMAAPGTTAGIFGGALELHARVLSNTGTIQAAGGTSTITAESIYNYSGAQILGFDAPDSTGALHLHAGRFENRGMVFGNSFLQVDAAELINYENGGIGSNGFMQISGVGIGRTPQILDNRGEIWGNEIGFTLPKGILNGRDPGDPANRSVPGRIFAATNLTMIIGENATLQNYGQIESAGNMTLQAYAGGATLRNEMSMVPEVEWWYDPTGASYEREEGSLGLVASNPRGDETDRSTFTSGGTTYYIFDETDGQSYAYHDIRYKELENQRLTVPESSIPQPGIRAGGNLTIYDFDDVVNNAASLGADGNLTISSARPASSVSNSGHLLYARDRITESTTVVRCHSPTHGAVNCYFRDHVETDGIAPIGHPVRHTAPRVYSNIFPGRIYAGGNVSITVGGTVSVEDVTNPYGGNGPNGPSAIGVVGVNQPGTVGARSGAPTLSLNGAQIPLPGSRNGRFVENEDPSTGPLIETNPLFGIDSIHLGSDYLARLLGLEPEEQARRLGDDNYEAWLIQEQVKASTGRGVLESYWTAGDMVQALFDNAAEEAERLDLGYGKALTPEQIASLKSDIVWMVEQEIDGQKVLVPVVYLTDATREAVSWRSNISGYNTEINAETVRNVGGEITAANNLRISTSGNIENLSGRMAGWNVRLDAGGDIVNSTLVNRSGDAQNGRDIAQRTATIEAGNTAVLTADRDINIRGAWVTAGKDAALIAERNVNIEALALTENTHLESENSSYTRQTQTALAGGVVAGGDVAIRAAEDVNIKGGDVAAGGTAILRADRGNVNIDVLELTSSSSSSETRTGRYDQLERDPENGTLGIGMGTEHRTVTNTRTQTIGVGSRISGSGVVVSTGEGDANITGSSIDAGEDGVFIDSAGNVNIAAYQEKDESTNTREAVRAGARIDGGYDGVHVGTQVSGDKITTTTTQTAARTSSITSGGNVIIRGQGDVTNEGTRIKAAEDVILMGENVINKAARDTYTTTTTEEKWDTKQQVGFTANGTGSSIAAVAKGESQQITVNNLEAQMRITGSYSDETATYTESRARGTEIEAGGNIIVSARNRASDEGTQYGAGNNIVISAEEYENKAAADTSSYETESTRAGGQLSGGLNSMAEVALNASAEGSHDKSSESSSTARTGSMQAGGKVFIEARSGDVTLEGTQVEGRKGVGISAAGDVNLLQANDTTSKSGKGESGSARLSGSIGVTGTSGSVGGGASGRTYENEERTSTARTASISSGEGNVQVRAGRDISSQGTDITAAGDVALGAGRDINLAAATSTVEKTGRSDGGGADVNVGFGMGSAKGTGSGGGSVDFERTRTDYSETEEKGSEITAGGNFSIQAGRDAHLEGTQVTAENASLDVGGNLMIESAQRTVKDDSYGVTGRIEASASKGGGMGGANRVGQGSSGSGRTGGNAGGGNAQVDYTRSYEDIETNTNASINTRGSTSVNVGGDMTLAGANINAQGGVSGRVGGNLTIESRADKEIVEKADVKAYAGIGAVGSLGNGSSKADRAQDGVQAGANLIAQTGVFTDVNAETKDNLTVNKKSGISGGTGGIDLRVGGDTTLKGAANQGSDFQTQGRTRVQEVETRINESKTDFRIAGTVASAAGSDQGKGGELNAGFNLPGGDDSPNAPRRPADADNDAPATRPRSDTVYANDPNVRPRTDTEYANNPYANAPRPRSDTEYANNPYGNAPRPRSDTEYANNPYANDPGLNRSSDANGPNAPIQDPRRVQPTGTADTYFTPVPASDPNRQQAAARSDGNPARPVQPSEMTDMYMDPSPRTRPATTDEAAPSQPPRPTDMVDTYMEQPGATRTQVASADTDAIRKAAQQAALELQQRYQAEVAQEVRKLIDNDPDAKRLRDRAAILDPNELKHFERNLAEIVAYSSRPDYQDRRAELFSKLERSLQGPLPGANGITEFPLRPQYLGEHLKDFDNWNTRAYHPNEKPGERYQRGENSFSNVEYYTPQERAQRRVYVNDDGKLVSPDGQPMQDGTYIFVVDREGNLIASTFRSGRYHHSSLSAGEPVRMAGEFEVKDGKLVHVSNQSGHFRPDQAAFEHFLRDLGRSGADLSNTVAPANSFSTDELGRFVPQVADPNLLKKGSNLRGGPHSMLAPMKKWSRSNPPRRRAMAPVTGQRDAVARQGMWSAWKMAA